MNRELDRRVAKLEAGMIPDAMPGPDGESATTRWILQQLGDEPLPALTDEDNRRNAEFFAFLTRWGAEREAARQ